jgi:hypothetical protein
MIALDLVPRIGAGPLLLGSTRDDIAKAAASIGLVKEAASGDVCDYFTENIVQIEYGDDGRALFIGIACNTGEIGALYQGKNLLDMTAKAALALVAKGERDNAIPTMASDPVLRDQIITFWDADTQYDHIRHATGQRPRKIWGQVGIGNDAYLAAIDEIAARD